MEGEGGGGGGERGRGGVGRHVLIVGLGGGALNLHSPIFTTSELAHTCTIHVQYMLVLK